MRSDRLLIAAFAIVAAAFLGGVWMLFYLRAAAGDIYPAYSSLRADPIGSRAFYESLESLGGFRLSRNYLPAARLRSAGAIFYIGSEARVMLNMPREEQAEFEELANNGARIVIGFAPVIREQKGGGGRLGRAWGFDVGYFKRDDDMPSLLHFKNPRADWTVLVKRDGLPALMERPFGRGSLVLSADSYRFSNEAMLRDRESAVLSRIIGDKRQIVFDEFHLGTEEEASVGALARRYRLQGVFMAVLLLGALFLWKSTSSFLPPLRESEAGEAVQGRSAPAGLTNLLKRSAPPAELLSACAAEWRKTARLAPLSKRQRIQDVLASGRQDTLGAYATIHQILKERH